MRPSAARPRRLTWLAPVGAFAVTAAVAAGAAFALLSGGNGDEDEVPAASDGSPSAIGRLEPLDAPSRDGRSVGSLPDGTLLRIEGRSADGGWLAVVELGVNGEEVASPVSGWVPVAEVDGVESPATLVVVEEDRFREPTLAGAPRTPTPTAQSSPTLTPDLPDLAVSAVYALDNELVVAIENVGNADADGPLEVSIDGREPHRIDVGKALRPGDILESTIEGEYVQRRGQVSVTLTALTISEENAGNNVFSGVVAPDVPNDIEIFTVATDAADDHIVVTLRNNSLIPLHGTVTLGVRQAEPVNQLLLRGEYALDIEAGGTQRIDLTEVVGIAPEFLRVILSTDAISDADTSNNTFPR